VSGDVTQERKEKEGRDKKDNRPGSLQQIISRTSLELIEKLRVARGKGGETFGRIRRAV
jgi:hypothetical protein